MQFVAGAITTIALAFILRFEPSVVVKPEVTLRKIDNAMSKYTYIALLTQADEGCLRYQI